jgi:DNA replicative helicase MCM subunit Mcm2 (Cdc46/Mcm family)
MKYYLEQAGMDEEGNIDMDKISGRMTSSKRNKIFTVRDTIFELSKEIGELIPVEKVIEKLEGQIKEEDVEDAIEKLKREGTLFQPRRGFIQKV